MLISIFIMLMKFCKIKTLFILLMIMNLFVYFENIFIFARFPYIFMIFFLLSHMTNTVLLNF